MSTESPTFNLDEVFSETKRLLNVNSSSYSYVTVCCFFLLPISILHIFYPSFHSSLSKLNPIFSTILVVFFTIFFLLTFLAFVCLITYTFFHAFYDRPSTLDASSIIQCLRSSFLPLLSTFIVCLLDVCLVILAFAICGFLICKVVLDINDVNVIYDWKYFYWIAILVVLLVASCVIYLLVNWFLAFVVSVVESRWGYASLRRSAYLIRGKKMMVLAMAVLFWIIEGGFVIQLFFIGSSDYFLTLYFVFGASMLMRYSLGASVVVYIHCMKMHGELLLGMETVDDEEIGDPDYMRRLLLPRDDNDEDVVNDYVDSVIQSGLRMVA